LDASALTIAATAMQMLANFIWISGINVAVHTLDIPAGYVAPNPLHAMDQRQSIVTLRLAKNFRGVR
jgi:hypothetical protein